jgi:putative PIN family toxin of toxin-antitoxin system
MRLVLDTDVVVAALRSPQGASAALIRCLDQGLGTLLLSVPLALEYEASCLLADHRLAAGLSQAEVDIFVNTLISLAVPVEVHFRWRPQLRDPCDEMVLETAVNGQAEAIVSFNHRDYGKAPESFGMELLLPREALRRIRP